jgi:hypothetical protein
MVWRAALMETLYAFGMMVGLMKGFAEPPKPVVVPPVAQHRVAEMVAKPRPHPGRKSEKNEWPLDY